MKFKAIETGTSFAEEPDQTFFFVVFGDADMHRIMVDFDYAQKQIVCQSETMDWAGTIADALNAHTGEFPNVG